jgi:hypothetical protein
MIYYEDNFLPEDQFIALQQRVSRRFVATDKKKFSENSDEPVRLTYHDVNGDWLEGTNYLGKECIPAVEKIISTMENIGVENLKNWSIWFQYIINTMTIPPHQDQELRKSDKANTYTAIIYTSEWQPGWGGEFIVGDPIFPETKEGSAGTRPASLTNLTHVIEPKPNRMLIWSRDVWHAVNKVESTDPNHLRSFFGTGWSSIDVFDRYSFDTGRNA